MRHTRSFLMICVTTIALSCSSAEAKPLNCENLLAGLQGSGDLGTDYGSILFGVVQTAKPPLCVPNGTMLGTLRAVFIHWADEHPGEMQTEAWRCAAKAFRDSFPCHR